MKAPVKTEATALPTVWTDISTKWIWQDEPPASTTGLNVMLYAARGESEGFQVVIRASFGRLSNVNFEVTDLLGTNGQVIPKSCFSLYREHYVYIQQSSPDWWPDTNRPLPPGWYPDALIPFIDPATGLPPVGGTLRAVPFDLKENNNQPIYVDISVPRNAGPGKYTGKFFVTSDQGNVQGQINLTVWNFELPLKPTLKSCFNVKNREVDGTIPNGVVLELLRHKIMPISSGTIAERQLIDNYGLNAKALGFWSGADYEHPYMKPAPSVETLQAAAATHEPDLYLYNATANEIGGHPELYDTIKEWGRNLHAAGVDNLIDMPVTPDLFDDGSGTGRSAVDVWSMLPKQYFGRESYVSQAMGKGDKIWSYNAQVQDGYSPKWNITYDPLNYRIQPGFISASLGYSGVKYWGVDRWTSDPWNDVITYSSSTGQTVYPGEAMLVYPGKQVGISGVAPSIRLKWLRDGVEDYEYVQILKRLGNKDLALQISRSVGADWKTWTHDAYAVENARFQLGQAIDGSEVVPPPPPKAEFKFGMPIFTDTKGNPVDVLIPSSWIGVKMDVKNLTTQEQSVTLVVELRSSTNVLMRTECVSAVLSPNQGKALSARLKLPKVVTGSYLRVFVVKGIVTSGEGLPPLSDVTIFPQTA